MMENAELLRVAEGAVSLARKAGRMMRENAPGVLTFKGTKENFATEMDVRIQVFLKDELLQLLPGSEFMGEENEEYVRTDSYLWIVDPIDGTVNYARGIPMSVISIGLVKGDDPIMGVVYNPYTEELFHAVKGNGAFLNDSPLHVSDRTKEESLVCTSWSAYDKELAPMCFRISERLQRECLDLRRIGTAAYELSMLAKGTVDMYFEMVLCPWDYAAASVIIKEAGGCIELIDGGLDFKDRCSVISANHKNNLEYLRDAVLSVMGPYRFDKSLWK